MFSLRSLTGFTLSVLVHGSVGAYILAHNFKAEKPKPKKIAMQMAMFKIAPPPLAVAKPVEVALLKPIEPEPIVKLAKPKPTVVAPPEKPVVKEIIKLEKPKPEPKPEKVVSKPAPVVEEKIAVIKPIPKPSIKVKPKPKKKKIIKKKKKLNKKKVIKHKKAIAQKKPKVKPKRKVQSKKRVIVQRKAAPKPHHARKPKPPLHRPTQRRATPKKVVRHAPPKRKANIQQRIIPKHTNKPAIKKIIAAKAKPAPRRPVQSRTVSNPHLEQQYGNSIRQRIKQKKSYPRRAKRMRKQGVVRVAFTISRNGIVSRLRIVKSSGVKNLDKAALSAVKKVGRFPAIPAGIHKSTWDFDIPIAYRLR